MTSGEKNKNKQTLQQDWWHVICLCSNYGHKHFTFIFPKLYQHLLNIHYIWFFWGVCGCICHTWRATTCCRAFWHLVYVWSLMMIMMTGMSLSTRASGPCFSSPARMPSECMYVISLIFYTGWKTKQNTQRLRHSKLTLHVIMVYVSKQNLSPSLY